MGLHLRPASRRRWIQRAALVSVLTLAALPVALSSSAGAAASSLHPVVVQRAVASFDGSTGQGVYGRTTLTVHLTQPTRRGDLLIAAVDDGVVTSGMVHPRYLFSHWDLGVTTIGGETDNDGEGPYRSGGLQASVYVFPDNPGGIQSIPVATVARGTQATVTVAIAEVSGVPAGLAVTATGTSTNGPTVTDYTQHSSVSTSSPIGDPPDLVVALFNNGGNSPNGERYVVSRGWTLIGSDTSPNNEDQPILANFRVVDTAGVVTERERYLGGYPIDNCAVIVALRSS